MARLTALAIIETGYEPSFWFSNICRGCWGFIVGLVCYCGSMTHCNFYKSQMLVKLISVITSELVTDCAVKSITEVYAHQRVHLPGKNLQFPSHHLDAVIVTSSSPALLSLFTSYVTTKLPSTAVVEQVGHFLCWATVGLKDTWALQGEGNRMAV